MLGKKGEDGDKRDRSGCWKEERSTGGGCHGGVREERCCGIGKETEVRDK